jgi:hypothetical protein
MKTREGRGELGAGSERIIASYEKRKVLYLGFPLSCRFLIRGEPPNKNAASRAPFQDMVHHTSIQQRQIKIVHD